MSLLATRIAALFTLFTLTLLVGVVPVFIFRFWTKKKSSSSLDITAGSKSPASAIVLQLLMFFGGGVLLATCFVHLIPEVRENFEVYFQNLKKTEGDNHSDHDHYHDHNDTHTHNDSDHEHEHEAEDSPAYGTNPNQNHAHSHSHSVPYVELAICGGFFMIYFLEELIHTIIGHDHHGEQHTQSQTTSLEVGNEFSCEEYVEKKSKLPLDEEVEKPSLSETKEAIDSLKKANGYDNYTIDLRSDACQPVFYTNSSKYSSTQIITAQSIESVSTVSSTAKLPVLVRFMQGLVTIGAFSAHSIFDGVAIGLQTSTSQIWTMLFAIAVHKLVVAFVVGMELFSQTSSVVITSIHMLLFSLTSPIGIVLVIFTESTISESKSPVLIILSAVATGTILYIIFFEILRRDKCKSVPGLVQFFAMIVGFAIMLCITLFIAH